MNLREEILEELRHIVLNVLMDEEVSVYLFGSWARHEEKTNSDIDIALEPVTQLSLSEDEAIKGLQMVNNRNLTVHNYHEEVAMKIHSYLKQYNDLLVAIIERMKEKI